MILGALWYSLRKCKYSSLFSLKYFFGGSLGRWLARSLGRCLPGEIDIKAKSASIRIEVEFN